MASVTVSPIRKTKRANLTFEVTEHLFLSLLCVRLYKQLNKPERSRFQVNVAGRHANTLAYSLCLIQPDPFYISPSAEFTGRPTIPFLKVPHKMTNVICATQKRYLLYAEESTS
jgi:hypothetical protein